MIQDSGERKVFETGAVRDIHDGKGRCDLLPILECVDLFRHFQYGDESTITFLKNIAKFMEAKDLDYIYQNIILVTKENDLNDIYSIILDVSKHFEEGCNKYGERNWEKGIPAHCYIDSAIRHYLKFKRGDVDENHARACVWNLLCLAWTMHNKPELDDICWNGNYARWRNDDDCLYRDSDCWNVKL